MKHLTGINIRVGLEIDVPIEDIFNPDASPVGDIRSKYFVQNEQEEKNQDEEFLKIVKKEDVVCYREFLISQELNHNLKVAVYNEYKVIYNKFSKQKFQSHFLTSLYFYNTEELSFEEFCFNLMTAQAFTGNFPQNNTNQHYFTGMGSFDITSVASVFPLAIAGNLNLEYFFIYYKKILTSVEKIIVGTIEDDVESQKEYVDQDEYYLIKKELEVQKKEISNILSNKLQN